MKLITLKGPVHGYAGLQIGDQAINLSSARLLIEEARCIPATIKEILAAGETALELLRRIESKVQNDENDLHSRLKELGAMIPMASTSLMAPVPNPNMVLSCGLNYKKHLHEMGGNVPEKPLAFSKSVQAIIGPDEAILLPKEYPNMVDWEIEFSAVIGRPCHNVSKADALDYVAGYTLINDVSARNWVGRFGTMQGMAAIEGWEHNLLGKHFPTFCPMGPTVVTKDELVDPDSVNIELKLNGEVMQSACTDDLVFSVADLIAYYSQFYCFQPGDIITTGSPAGVGFGRQPFIFLKDGDLVTIGAAQIGSMTNTVKSS